MAPLICLPLVPLVANGTKCDHRTLLNVFSAANDTNIIGRIKDAVGTNGTIVEQIGTNGDTDESNCVDATVG